MKETGTNSVLPNIFCRKCTPFMKNQIVLIIYFFLFVFFILGNSVQCGDGDYVILLHGLSRTSNSMLDLEESLTVHGYEVLNLDYQSRKDSIQGIVAGFIEPEINKFCIDTSRQIHFVTHSLGGIILRYYLTTSPRRQISRAVMLSPPNKGSEIVDFLGQMPLVSNTLGPAFKQLSADSSSFVNSLGPIQIETGIITGDRTINFINSTIIPGPDDGKVSVETARLDGMKDFLVVHRTHPFIMDAPEVLEQIAYFLEYGRFMRD